VRDARVLLGIEREFDGYFCRFLKANDFAKKVMKIRPDNAKGFLNLKRVLHELNTGRGYGQREGFLFYEDYARASTPIDKAHLESSHRSLHKFEQQIIEHFSDRVVGQYMKNKISNNVTKKVTVNSSILLWMS